MKEVRKMGDLLFLGLIFFFFWAAFLFVGVCERLRR